MGQEPMPTVALSIRQPWAWLICAGHKDIENRNWSTTFRGPVLIHAGLAWGRDERETLLDLRRGENPADGRPLAPSIDEIPEDMELGGIVGRAEIVGCVTASDSRWFVGRFGFVLRNAQPLPYTPCRGQLGLFRPAQAVIDALNAATILEAAQ